MRVAAILRLLAAYLILIALRHTGEKVMSDATRRRQLHRVIETGHAFNAAHEARDQAWIEVLHVFKVIGNREILKEQTEQQKRARGGP